MADNKANKESKGLVCQTEAKKQNRGRNLNLWKLSRRVHQRFRDVHERVEHLLDGARRCTFKISPKNSSEMRKG